MGAWEDRVVGKVVRQPFRSYVSGPRSREISKRTHTHTNTHVRVHEHTYTPTHIHTCTQMHAPIYLCTHIYTPRQCVRTHTHTHTHFCPLRPSSPGCTEQGPRPVCGNSTASFPGCREGTRKAIPLQTGLRTLQNQCSAAPAFPGPLPLRTQPLLS